MPNSRHLLAVDFEKANAGLVVGMLSDILNRFS